MFKSKCIKFTLIVCKIIFVKLNNIHLGTSELMKIIFHRRIVLKNRCDSISFNGYVPVLLYASLPIAINGVNLNKQKFVFKLSKKQTNNNRSIAVANNQSLHAHLPVVRYTSTRNRCVNLFIFPLVCRRTDATPRDPCAAWTETRIRPSVRPLPSRPAWTTRARARRPG